MDALIGELDPRPAELEEQTPKKVVAMTEDSYDDDEPEEVEEVVVVEDVHAPTIHRTGPMGHLPNRYWTAGARAP